MFEKPPFTEAEEQKILEAIKSAESNTSGEIRLHIEKHCKIDPYDRAIEVFEKLGMTKTEQRNGKFVELIEVTFTLSSCKTPPLLKAKIEPAFA